MQCVPCLCLKIGAGGRHSLTKDLAPPDRETGEIRDSRVGLCDITGKNEAKTGNEDDVRR